MKRFLKQGGTYLFISIFKPILGDLWNRSLQIFPLHHINVDLDKFYSVLHILTHHTLSYFC